MRLVTYFDAFLNDTVNINRSRLIQLDDRVDAIYGALAEDDTFGAYLRDKIPQGSWPHRTIIKPLPRHEFDADVLLLLDENPEWSEHPRTYIGELYKALGRSGTYTDMRSRKNRCVRVTYANDCHIDLVPFVELTDGQRKIVNRDDDTWEDTDPEGFNTWMRQKDDIAVGNLRKVIRLVKYLRDHKGTFTGTRSIILTTLLGERVVEVNKAFDPAYYGDVPTALKNIMNDLDTWLQARPNRPLISDPSGSGASFDHRWDDTTYANLRDKVHKYAADITAAFDEDDKDTSVELWQAVFGEDFKGPTTDNSGRFGTVAAGTSTSRGGRAG